MATGKVVARAGGSDLAKVQRKVADKIGLPGLDSKTEGAGKFAAGNANVIGGLASGNRRQMKEGAGQFIEGGWNIASAAPARSAIKQYFKGPQHEHAGGSAAALAGLRGKYAAGQEQGSAYTAGGIDAYAAGM